jgi:hypothetical protein
MGFHSLTTTTHPPHVNLPTSGQQVTTRLSVHKVSVTGGNRAQDPLVRDTTKDNEGHRDELICEHDSENVDTIVHATPNSVNCFRATTSDVYHN